MPNFIIYIYLFFFNLLRQYRNSNTSILFDFNTMNFEKIIILSCIYQSAEMGSSLLFIYRRINYNKKCTSDWYITSYILFRNISVSYILLYDTILSLFLVIVNANFVPLFCHLLCQLCANSFLFS